MSNPQCASINPATGSRCVFGAFHKVGYHSCYPEKWRDGEPPPVRECQGSYDDCIGERRCSHTTLDGCPDAPPCAKCDKRHTLWGLGKSDCTEWEMLGGKCPHCGVAPADHKIEVIDDPAWPGRAKLMVNGYGVASFPSPIETDLPPHKTPVEYANEVARVLETALRFGDRK